MSWIFKGDNGMYLHDFRVGFYGRIEELKWDESQRFAYRFYDRNVVSKVGAATKVPGTIITLTSGGINKRLDDIEASNLRMRSLIDASFEKLGKTMSGLLHGNTKETP